MATATAKAYEVISGEVIYGGRYKPGPFGTMVLDGFALSGGFAVDDGVPAWMSGAVLNRWTQIPNSTGAGGAAVDPWGGLVLDTNLDLLSPVNGGHGDSSDNRVSKIALGVDTPSAWAVVNPASINRPAPAGTLPADAPYFYDDAGGTTNPKPGSRHNYQSLLVDDTTRRIYLVGYQATYPNGLSANTIDGYNLDTNTWDAPGTYPTTGSDGPPWIWWAPALRLVWWTAGGRVYRWVPGAAAKTDIGAYAGSAWQMPGRYPSCYDPTRNQFFHLYLNNGQGGASTDTLTSMVVKTPDGTPTQQAITLNSIGGALAQLKADQPAYADMDYDVLRDEFRFFAGGTFTAGGSVSTTDATRMYIVKPTSGTTWDISVSTIAPGGATPGPLASGGINRRFIYVQRGGVGGFLCLMSAADSVHFFRTT